MTALIENLALGFGVSITPFNLAFCFLGTLLGTLIGVLPGIGPVATIAMLLPVTFGLPPTTAIIMLAGIFYGAQYGGSTTAILINIPGESSSVVTALDGYSMARAGRAGAALAIAALGSFFAGCVATAFVAAIGPLLSKVALSFAPADYFSLMVMGLFASIVLASGSVLKAVAMIVAGLALGLVGADIETGVPRFTFGRLELYDGINFVPVAMGLFGVAEVLRNLETSQNRIPLDGELSKNSLTGDDLRMAWPAVLRGTGVGTFLGVLP
ncbi:MAG: tripartite tricarboxylate transporter permease, partial [Pseudorhodoplanes sp.]